jgi:hypothetical protein
MSRYFKEISEDDRRQACKIRISKARSSGPARMLVGWRCGSTFEIDDEAL